MTEPAIDTGEILEALNDKSDRDLHNIDTSAGADVVVSFQAPTAENNYTWFRLYKSGWIEQGGEVTKQGETNQLLTIYLIKPMADTSYFVQRVPITTSTGDMGTSHCFYVYSKSTDSFQAYYGYASIVSKSLWKVEGMSAQS